MGMLRVRLPRRTNYEGTKSYYYFPKWWSKIWGREVSNHFLFCTYWPMPGHHDPGANLWTNQVFYVNKFWIFVSGSGGTNISLSIFLYCPGRARPCPSINELRAVKQLGPVKWAAKAAKSPGRLVLSESCNQLRQKAASPLSNFISCDISRICS